MNKNRISGNFVNTVAIIISLLTLCVFIYQTNLIRKDQHMSVYPHLMVTNGNSGTLNYQYLLRNEGVGPAIIESIDISLQDGQTFSSLTEYLNNQISKKDSIAYHHTDIYPGRLIPSGEQLVLFGLWDDENSEILNYPKNTIQSSNKLRSILNNDKLNLEIKYKSIYDDRWKITNKSSSPTEY